VFYVFRTSSVWQRVISHIYRCGITVRDYVVLGEGGGDKYVNNLLIYRKGSRR